jgi:hypothetical protein
MADAKSIRAVGGPFDGGMVEDLGTTHQWIDAGGWAYHVPGPGRVLYVRQRDTMLLVDQIHAEMALVVLSDPERIRPVYELHPIADWPFERYLAALEVLASVARDDDGA